MAHTGRDRGGHRSNGQQQGVEAERKVRQQERTPGRRVAGRTEGYGLAGGTVISALGITFVPIGSDLAVPFYIDLEPRYFLIPAAITLPMTAGAALVSVVRTARMSVDHVLRHE